MKLTKAQAEFLRQCTKSGGRAALSTYKPAIRLSELGLIRRATTSNLGWGRTWGNPTFVATEAGRQWLAEHASEIGRG